MKRKILKALLFMCILFWGPSVTASAASSKTIQRVYLYITSEIEVGTQDDYVRVVSESRRCWVDETEVTNVPKHDWESDDKPRLRITLRADEDYVFDSDISKTKISLSGDEGKVTNVTRKGNDKLLVYVTLNALEGEESSASLEVEDLEWDEKSGFAYWGEAGDAKRYELRLYRDEIEVTSATLKTMHNYYDFSPRMTRAGYYYFKVRAVSRDETGDWKTSEKWYVSAADAANLSAGQGIPGAASQEKGPRVSQERIADGWEVDDKGLRYRDPEGSFVSDAWCLIGEVWYYFNAEGYMAVGWNEVDGKWYYLDLESGALYRDMVTPDGYRVGSDGAWTGD